MKNFFTRKEQRNRGKSFVLDKEDFQKEVTGALKLILKKDHFMI